jgi:hypothetical protein
LSLGDVLEVVEVGDEQAGRAMHKAHSAVLSGYSPSLEMPAHSEAWRSSRASGSRTGCLAIGRCSSPIRSSRLQLLVSVGRVGNRRVERWWHHPPAPMGSRDVPSRETSPQAARQAVAFGGWRHLGTEVGRDPFATECALLDPSNARPGTPMQRHLGVRRTPELAGIPRR